MVKRLRGRRRDFQTQGAVLLLRILSIPILSKGRIGLLAASLEGHLL